MLKKTLIVALSALSLSLGISTNTFANSANYVTPTLNKNGDPEFKQLKPARSTYSGQKIEVVEMFYYGCSHCFELEADLIGWKKTLGKDVVFKRIPAVFRAEWEPYAKLFYTLETMNILEKYHADVFNTVQMENVDLTRDEVLTAWLKKQGIDSKKFMEIYKSFAIRSKVEFSKKLTQSYEIKGVPSLIINGKYMTSGSMTLDFKRMLNLTNTLIAKERESK